MLTEEPEIQYIRTTPLPATNSQDARIRVTANGFRFVTPRNPALDGPAAHDEAVKKFKEKIGLTGTFQRIPNRDHDFGYRYQRTDHCIVCGSFLAKEN